MKPWGRWLLVGLVCLAVAVGVVYVAVSANETLADGSADPILFLRRPVVKALIWAGVLRRPGFMENRYRYLPTTGGYEWSAPRDVSGEHVPMGKVEVTKEPVYRGLLWMVGHRITYRRTEFGESDGYCAVRLWYADGSRKVLAAESPHAGPEVRRSEVSGFVPSSARGFWVECANEKGDLRSDAWGDCEPYEGD